MSGNRGGLTAVILGGFRGCDLVFDIVKSGLAAAADCGATIWAPLFSVKYGAAAAG
jgi:hypothetical protein